MRLVNLKKTHETPANPGHSDKMAVTNTIMHRRFFEDLISSGDAETQKGDEVAYAILYAALAAARKRLGAAKCADAVRDFLANDD